MNPRLEQFRDRLQEEVKAAEGSLAKAVHHLTSASGMAVKDIEACLKETQAECEAKRAQAEHAGQRIKQFLEETTAHAIARYEDWKTDREIAKLERHADEREEQAADAVVVAAYALLQAELAIVEALKARKIAIEVAG
jgi:hypothetical protein